MSYQRREGKDTVIFLSKEDLKEPSQVKLDYEKEDEEQMGLIKPDGEINWNCPCLQGMADGPCGQEFKESFSCFHFSEADPKGSDCIDQFRSMQECFMQYPEVYAPENDKEINSQETEATEDAPVLSKEESDVKKDDQEEIVQITEIATDLRTETIGSDSTEQGEAVVVSDNLESEAKQS